MKKKRVTKEELLQVLVRLVEICDREATFADGSNPDTSQAHALFQRMGQETESKFCVRCHAQGVLLSQSGVYASYRCPKCFKVWMGNVESGDLVYGADIEEEFAQSDEDD